MAVTFFSLFTGTMVTSELLSELDQILQEDFGKKYTQDELFVIAEDILCLARFLTNEKGV